MKITFKAQASDPVHPIMHGTSPTAKEFNKRQEKIWGTGKVDKIDFEQICTVLLEIFAEDYDRRHAPRKKKNIKR
jgi:hypothetical protein